MMNCDQALELISASLDLPLTPDEQRELDQHLANCPACRALLADFQKIHQELSQRPPAEPPAALCQGVMDRIRAEKTPAETSEKIIPIRRTVRPWVRWGAAAAVFAVVLLGAGSSGMLDAILFGNAGTAAPPQSSAAQQEQTAGQAVPRTGQSAAGGADASADEGQEPQDAETPQAASADQSAGDGAAAPTASPQSRSQNETAAGETASSAAGPVMTPQATAAPTTVIESVPTAPPQVNAVTSTSSSGAASSDSQEPTLYQQAPEMPAVSSGVTAETTENGVLTGSAAPLTQEQAEKSLENWLKEGAEDAKSTAATQEEAGAGGVELTSLGQSEDGSCWLFALETDGGVVRYAVPLDGGEIYRLEGTD